jgi:hypothetical protein
VLNINHQPPGAGRAGRKEMNNYELKKLCVGELVKVDHDWYVYDIAKISGKVDEETGEVETIHAHALYTTSEWFSYEGPDLTIKPDNKDLNEYISSYFEHYTTPDKITRTGKFLKGYKPTPDSLC